MRHLFTVVSLLIAATLFAQEVDLNKLDAYFEKTAKDWGIPGMSVGIVKFNMDNNLK